MVEKRIKILLVEDDPDDVWVMRNLLGDRWDVPFDLVQVELLSAAIQRSTEDAFDVILLDLSLPDSRGLETFFAMHAHAGDVPIVVLSGHDDEQSAVRAVQAGARTTSSRARSPTICWCARSATPSSAAGGIAPKR